MAYTSYTSYMSYKDAKLLMRGADWREYRRGGDNFKTGPSKLSSKVEGRQFWRLRTKSVVALASSIPISSRVMTSRLLKLANREYSWEAVSNAILSKIRVRTLEIDWGEENEPALSMETFPHAKCMQSLWRLGRSCSTDGKMPVPLSSGYQMKSRMRANRFRHIFRSHEDFSELEADIRWRSTRILDPYFCKREPVARKKKGGMGQ